MKFNGSLQQMEVVGTPNKPIKDTRDISLNISVSEIDVTTRDSGGWTEVIAGVRGFTGKVTGVIDWASAAAKTTQADLINYAIARALVNFVFTTKQTGDSTFTGAGIFTNVTFSAPHEGEVTWSADVKGSGALVPAVIA